MSAQMLKDTYNDSKLIEKLAVLQCIDDGDSLKKEIPLSSLVLSGKELSEYQSMPVEIFIDPFLNRGSLVLVYAQRGLGKTWFALELALSLARGGLFFEYKVQEKWKVLLIDGEMRLSELKCRLEKLAYGNIPESLFVLSSERLAINDQSLNINNSTDQLKINRMIDERLPDVVILDNLSSLRYGVDENSNSDQDSIIQWLRLIRHKGVAVVIIHHAGKNGDIRGASRLEDILDYIINLKKVPSVDDGASFSISFTKCRGKKPKPSHFTVSLIDNDDKLEWKSHGNEKKLTVHDDIIHQLHVGKFTTQKDLCKKLGKDEGYISKELQKLQDKQMVTESNKLKLTPHGKKYAESIQYLLHDYSHDL